METLWIVSSVNINSRESSHIKRLSCGSEKTMHFETDHSTSTTEQYIGQPSTAFLVQRVPSSVLFRSILHCSRNPSARKSIILKPQGEIMSRSHVSNTTLSLGSTGAPATPQGKKMGKWKGSHLYFVNRKSLFGINRTGIAGGNAGVCVNRNRTCSC